MIAPRWSLIASGLLFWLSACGRATPDTVGLKPLEPTFDSRVTPEQISWARTVWPSVLAACPGLSSYRGDLGPSEKPGYFVDSYFNPGEHALIAVFKVSEQPASKKLWQYHSPGNNCFFAMEYPSGAAVHIAKTACESLCLDEPRTYEKEDLRLPLGR